MSQHLKTVTKIGDCLQQKISPIGLLLQAYEYIVNDKPALEWIMERDRLTRD